MTTIEKIKAEIERRYKEFDGKTGDIATASRLAYLDVISFLDTLESEKPVPADLEKAAKAAATEVYTYTLQGMDDLIGLFKAGAEWQKQHDAELIEIAYNDGITIGMTKQKEQMLKEAVEGKVYDFRRIKEIGYSSAKIEFDKIPELDDGDKVRVIVCKKED